MRVEKIERQLEIAFELVDNLFIFNFLKLSIEWVKISTCRVRYSTLNSISRKNILECNSLIENIERQLEIAFESIDKPLFYIISEAIN